MDFNSNSKAVKSYLGSCPMTWFFLRNPGRFDIICLTVERGLVRRQDWTGNLDITLQRQI